MDSGMQVAGAKRLGVWCGVWIKWCGVWINVDAGGLTLPATNAQPPHQVSGPVRARPYLTQLVY